MKIAAHQFCSFQWEALKEEFDSNKHAYTRTFQLPQRCVESLYMVTLLERGFGLDEDYKGVTIALEVILSHSFNCSVFTVHVVGRGHGG